MSESGKKDWRELCDAAAKEKDPAKFALLIEELLEALNEKKRQRSLRNAGEEASYVEKPRPA